MHVFPNIVLLALLATAASGHVRLPARYFELVNASKDAVVSVEVSAKDGGGFQPLRFDAPLRGGFQATTLVVPGTGCVRDFRIGFRDGRTLRYPDIDVCRNRGLKLTPRDGK